MTTEHMRTRDFWRSFAPHLHIEDGLLLKNIAPIEFTATSCQETAAQLNEEGYFQSMVNWDIEIELMAHTIRSLTAELLSPVFGFVYDEFWYPFLKLHLLYAGLLGGKYFLLPEFWAWNVDPKNGESGWKPHRDRGRASLFEDGSPKSLTTWIPLTAATPLNGCIYAVPRPYDQTYATDEDLTWKFDYQSVRALPAEPGDFLIWNQELLHWGGKTSPRAKESRISLAFEMQRADVPPFTEPLLEPLQVPPFEMRLKLIARLILQYQHMYALEKNLAKFAADVVAA